MKRYDEASPLISIHVPKAGGTSFSNLLQKWYTGGRLYTHYRHADGNKPKQVALEGSICIHGHFNSAFGFGLPQYYPQADQFIAFLREPFDRFLSLWFYYQKLHREGIALAAEIPEIGTDFEAFLYQRASEQQQGVNSFSFLHHFPSPPDPNSIIPTLRNFVFVGTMERYDESVEALARSLKKPTVKIPHLNETRRPEHDFDKYRQFYQAQFADEYEVYREAVKINNDLIDSSAAD